MGRTLNLILGIIAAANVIYSFWGNLETATIFGISMNIWLYRLIWALFAAVFFYSYFKARKVNR